MRTLHAERFWEIDLLRGIALLLMISYHAVFDLGFFGLIDFDSSKWRAVPWLIGSLFLLLVGVSLSISFSRLPNLSFREIALKQFKRGFFLAAIAGAITFATWIYPHEGFIVFGVIHLIAFSVLVSPAFKGFKRLNLALGIAIIAAGIFASTITLQTPFLAWLGFAPQNFYTLDYYPALPWLGVVLIGMFIGKTLYSNATRAFNLPKNAPRVALLEFLGRHSLAIYLAHQPILVGLVLAYKLLAG